MATHSAVAMVGVRTALEIRQMPTVTPTGDEVRVRVDWTASTPLDLHQADGGLLVQHPQIMGDTISGVVVEVGPDAKNLAVGDAVFGFMWRNAAEKAHQEFVTTPEYLLGKIPANTPPQEAVTLPDNFVTVFHAVTKDLQLPLPWPKPDSYTPPQANTPILVWGGSSSVGQYFLQILTYYGYKNLLATASAAHHASLKQLGAAHVFDYRNVDVVQSILSAAGGSVPFILDCIGSKNASVAPVAQIAGRGSRVGVLLPVIVKDASATEAPEYAMDVQASAKWAEGVEASGVRTHTYLDNELFKAQLQPTIMPTFLSAGIVKPNKQRIVEAPTLLERAEAALDILRNKGVSGERLVWRVSTPASGPASK